MSSVLPSTIVRPALVAVAASVVLLWNLGGPALWDEDEPKNAACSLAMLDRGDWIVPTFNGRLRVEKPALVNWVHMAGFAVAGRDETGARLGSACLTVGTCLLTWSLAAGALGAEAGLVAGLALASCVWTAVAGRSATPDAPLCFFTTLGLWCFLRASARPGPDVARDRRWIAACGAALGAATLAKGPVGLALPLAAFLAHAVWEGVSRGDGPVAPRLRASLAAVRAPLLVTTAVAVALPWYLAVTLRTRGEWLAEFLFVHNVGRFAAPMEGHDGPAALYYPVVLAVGFFPWSIVLAATLAHGVSLSSRGDADRRTGAVRLLVCWLCCWVAAFSVAGTKLPGYVWPAYPALAALTGDFLAAWIRGEAWCTLRCREPRAALEKVMHLAWSILGLAGIGMGAALVAAPWWGVPALRALAPLGLVPLCGAIAAARLQHRSFRRGAAACLAVSACVTVACLAAFGADAVGGARAARRVVAALGGPSAPGAWAGFGNVPPSVVFYARDVIPLLESTEAVEEHLASRPDARLVVDSRFEMNLPSPLPPGCAVLARERPLFGHGLVVIGRPPSDMHGPQQETPLAWHTKPRSR